MRQRFGGKVAVVTGAASGIGFAVAQRLAEEGARVAILDMEGAERAAKDIGGDCLGLAVDVSDQPALEATVQSVVKQFGALHVLVNNAGIDGAISPLADYPLDAYHRVLDVNLSGVFFGMRSAIPHLIAADGGAIVNIASGAAVKSFPAMAPYAATKAAVVRLTLSAAVEYAPVGVRINAVLPGAIETPLMRQVFDDSPEIRATVMAQTPLGRVGTPAELAASVAFLASDEASFITGIAMPTDGGFSAT